MRDKAIQNVPEWDMAALCRAHLFCAMNTSERLTVFSTSGLQRLPLIQRDGRIITFGIAKNLPHAQWCEISSNLKVRT